MQVVNKNGDHRRTRFVKKQVRKCISKLKASGKFHGFKTNERHTKFKMHQVMDDTPLTLR